jgi:hypothetical protein
MSIQHFNQQSLKRQRAFLEHPEEFVCQEKIDGTHLNVICDNGVISIKHNKKVYRNVADWEINFWTSQFREAHLLVLQAQANLIAQYGNDFDLHCEILSPHYPNTVKYDTDVNRLVIFQPDNIVFHTTGHIANFQYPVTADGVTTTMETRSSDWEIISLPEIPQLSWTPHVHMLVNADPYTQLMEKLIKGRTSMFGKGDIEGLVFRHSSGWQFKLVDRDAFTAQNTRNQALRRKLFRSPFMRDNTIMDQYMRDSVIDVKLAATTALNAVETLFAAYKADTSNEQLDEWVKLKNLEAIVSVRNQLQGIIDGR